MSLGFIGVFLPVLPTVPFFLLALFAFSKSSQKWHDYLYNHPVFGPSLHDWRENGVIRRPAKWLATISISTAVIIQLLIGVNYKILGVEILIFVSVLSFIWTRPERKMN